MEHAVDLVNNGKLYTFACISDTHGMHNSAVLKEALEANMLDKDTPYDFLIHAGDCTGHGSKYEAEEFIQWFSKQNARHKIFIAGNHDFVFAHEKLEMPDGVYYLQDSGVELDGIKFWGSPITPIFYDWAFMKDETEQRWHFDLIPTDTDVVITHGPPYGILDENMRGITCGSRPLYDRIKDVQPKLHIFGHIHEGVETAEPGKDHIGKTTCINASCLNGRYLFHEEPVRVISSIYK